MADKKKQKHLCPKIVPEFSRKMTGPAWNGEDAATARRMWNRWLRDLDKHCVKMPRNTNRSLGG